ncbi:MAG: DUF547 domain-containing protein [Flavobacteriales bacterium]|nr:DUF547 domain-containing protein [Flavobacteriales bacterium]
MKGGLSISQQLIKAVKSKKDYIQLVNTLSSISIEELSSRLATDNQKKAFWLNIYNAYNIILLNNDSSVLLNSLSRKRHFSTKAISIAGYNLSLDSIEHGMIRNSKVWWSRGYLNKPIVSNFEKLMRIKQLDPRIHFALNCGATSCPAIRFYCDQQIEEQLEFATKTFLDSEVIYNQKNKSVKISRLFDWYIGDFGGKKGVLQFLSKYNALPDKMVAKINYSEYSWEPMVGAFG